MRKKSLPLPARPLPDMMTDEDRIQLGKLLDEAGRVDLEYVAQATASRRSDVLQAECKAYLKKQLKEYKERCKYRGTKPNIAGLARFLSGPEIHFPVWWRA